MTLRVYHRVALFKATYLFLRDRQGQPRALFGVFEEPSDIVDAVRTLQRSY